MELEKLQSAKKFFFIALAIDIVVTLVVVWGDIWIMGALKDIESGAVIFSKSIQSTLDFWDNFSKLLYLTLIGVGFTLFKWLKSCYGFAKTSLQTTGFKNEGWVIWGWIVPFMNFFKPYQVISEIYKAGSPNNCNGEDWKKESGSGLLLTWWICWLVAHMIMWEYTKKVLAFKALLMKSGAPPLSEGLMFAQINNLNVWHLIVCALSIIVAVFWFAVANHLTNRLVARSARKMPTQQSNTSASTKAAPLSSGQRSVPVAPVASQTVDAIQTPPVTQHIMNNPPSVNAMPTIAVEPSQQSMPEIEDRLYEQIAQEIEANAVDQGTWTKAFAQSGGDDKQTRVAYIKTRFEKLLAAEKIRLGAYQREQELNAIEKIRLGAYQREQELNAIEKIRLGAYQREQELDALEKMRLEAIQHEWENAETLQRLYPGMVFRDLIAYQREQDREALQRKQEEIIRNGIAHAEALRALQTSVEWVDFKVGCSRGSIDEVKKAAYKDPLLLYIANSNDGMTALHLAVNEKQQEVARFLAECGAKVGALNSGGETPIDIAKRKGQAELASLLQSFSQE